MKVVDFDGDTLIIRFRVDSREEFASILGRIKENIVGRQWESKSYFWRAPVIPRNLQYLREMGFYFTPAAKALETPVEEGSRVVRMDERLLVGFFPYQVEGVRFLERREGVGIIGDEMGLGKTAQALGYLMVHPEYMPALVICPATAKFVWLNEVLRWMKLRRSDVHIFSSRTSAQVRRERKIYLINYDILKDWLDVLVALPLQTVIGDEVQYVANLKAKRTKAFIQLARPVGRRIFLSGTPIKNYPSEFFTVLNLVQPRVFPNQWAYLQRYCNPKYNGFGWVFKGASNQEELRSLVAPLMIRREKSEVLLDLPEKLKQVVPLECGEVEMKAYQDASEEFKEWVRQNIRKKAGAQAMNQVERLKQMAYLAKRNSVLRWMHDFLDTGQKLVIFAVHLNVLSDIEREFKDICVRVDGNTPVEERQRRIERFQKDPSTRLFVGQIIAAGVAITLTASSSVAFLELPWTNADLDQAADRCHRIGQRCTVNIYYLIADGTVENKIMRLLDRKKEVLTKLIAGKDVQEEELLTTLLQDTLKDEGEVIVESQGD